VIGVESVTPTRRGAAQDPSSDPALQGRGGVISGSGSLEKLKAIAERAPMGEEGLREVENALGFKPPTRLHTPSI